MKKHPVIQSLFVIFTLMTVSASNCENPFFKEWNTPYGAPPFSQIKVEHFVPAYEKAVEEEKAEVEAIVSNAAPVSFENTIVALDKTGALLSKVGGVFNNLVGADTSDELQAADKVITPLVSAHRAEIRLNQKLFARVKDVYDNKNELDLDEDEAYLLENTYLSFVRNGALLGHEKKDRYKEIVKELSLLTLQFGQNVLKDAKSLEIIVENKSELEGIPSLIVEAAAAKANERGYEGKWLFLPTRATVEPVTTYAENRDLRQKLFEGYVTCGDRDNEYNNNEIAAKLVALRIEKANLLGYKSHADYVLENRMAGNAEKVMGLVNKVWEPAIATAQKEVADMQKLANAEGHDFKLAAWDYRYYAEKIRQQRYALDVEELAPYFTAANVQNGIFNLIKKLYDVDITPENNVPTYRHDVDAWKVADADGSLIGIFYSDWCLRDSKRAGAWMSAYCGQVMDDEGERVAPIIVNVCNFPNPVGDTPSLLTLDHVTTAFHEFGHATHGLFSNCRFKSQAGTSVKRDFVELPSQILENWAFEPELLKTYAFHYQTGEVIPDELIEKIQKASYFNQGFFTTEFLAAAILDMEYHKLEQPLTESVSSFETRILKDTYGLIDEVYPRYRSTYFQHIFSGGYSAGYYSYLWAEVLDADAFNAFKETDLFSKEVAQKFRETVLSSGGSKDPMSLYMDFRGEEPSTKPLLKRRGFL